MGTNYSITEYFGKNLAKILSDKILKSYKDFNNVEFISNIEKNCNEKTYTQRVELIADMLKKYLPNNYEQSVNILTGILGAENPYETGMFKNFYWVLPIGKFVEKYGLEDYKISIEAIGEITKRNTGEYAIRPFVRKYPQKTLKQMKLWSHSDNFHLRRLSSEGLRPKLPWAPKLETFIDTPEHVFEILDNLKEDRIKFVKKSVANHLTDWLKLNPEPTLILIKNWSRSKNENTRWIIKHATRKINITLLENAI